jgi:hypothetical protein
LFWAVICSIVSVRSCVAAFSFKSKSMGASGMITDLCSGI